MSPTSLFRSSGPALALLVLCTVFCPLVLAVPDALAAKGQPAAEAAQRTTSEDQATLQLVQEALDKEDYRTAVALLTPLAN